MKSALLWLGLMLMLAAEFFAAHSAALHSIVPYIGIAMALLMAFTFMELGSARGPARIFALAGFFWLLIMMGLGSLDSATRRDIRVPLLAAPGSTDLPGR